jgi:predicted dienelactone hydrolase
MLKPFILAAAASLAFGPSPGAVGQLRIATSDATAALRDGLHRSGLRVTVWYPAKAGAAETRIDIGPADHPVFVIGAAAPDAPFVDTKQRPTVLVSHGFGGSARMMGWFGTALARAGYVVIAVDHPGSNGLDALTVPGGVLWWDRVQDLRAALEAAKNDPAVGVHIDAGRVGVAGFSAGGGAALLSVGARADLEHFAAFCRSRPADGVCAPQMEFAISDADRARILALPDIAKEVARAREDMTLRDVRAAFVMAPALVQAMSPESPGVGHYDFLGVCTVQGHASAPACAAVKAPQDATHKAAVDMALAFFGAAMGPP